MTVNSPPGSCSKPAATARARRLRCRRLLRPRRRARWPSPWATARCAWSTSPIGETWRTVEAHDGAVLSLRARRQPPRASSPAATTANSGVGDRRSATSPTSASKWVEQVAAHAGEKSKGLLACRLAKPSICSTQTGEKLKELDPSIQRHRPCLRRPSGKRVAASHYNGATLWFVGAKDRHALAAWNGRAAIPPSRSIPTARRW